MKLYYTYSLVGLVGLSGFISNLSGRYYLEFGYITLLVFIWYVARKNEN